MDSMPFIWSNAQVCAQAGLRLSFLLSDRMYLTILTQLLSWGDLFMAFMTVGKVFLHFLYVMQALLVELKLVVGYHF